MSEWLSENENDEENDKEEDKEKDKDKEDEEEEAEAEEKERPTERERKRERERARERDCMCMCMSGHHVSQQKSLSGEGLVMGFAPRLYFMLEVFRSSFFNRFGVASFPNPPSLIGCPCTNGLLPLDSGLRYGTPA